MSKNSDYGCQWVLGYMINEPWLLQTAFDRQWCLPLPGHSFETVKSHGLSKVIDEVLRRSKIRDIRIDAVWVGEHTTALCWVLPMSFSKKYRTKEEDRALERFRDLLRVRDSAGRLGAGGLNGEPMLWASSEGRVPSMLRGFDEFTKRCLPYSLKYGEGFTMYVISLSRSDLRV